MELSNDPDVLMSIRVEHLGTMQIELHVFGQFSSMEDIQFTDPLLSKEDHRLVKLGHSLTYFIQQQQN